MDPKDIDRKTGLPTYQLVQVLSKEQVDKLFADFQLAKQHSVERQHYATKAQNKALKAEVAYLRNPANVGLKDLAEQANKKASQAKIKAQKAKITALEIHLSAVCADSYHTSYNQTDKVRELEQQNSALKQQVSSLETHNKAILEDNKVLKNSSKQTVDNEYIKSCEDRIKYLEDTLEISNKELCKTQSEKELLIDRIQELEENTDSDLQFKIDSLTRKNKEMLEKLVEKDVEIKRLKIDIRKLLEQQVEDYNWSDTESD